MFYHFTMESKTEPRPRKAPAFGSRVTLPTPNLFCRRDTKRYRHHLPVLTRRKQNQNQHRVWPRQSQHGEEGQHPADPSVNAAAVDEDEEALLGWH